MQVSLERENDSVLVGYLRRTQAQQLSLSRRTHSRLLQKSHLFFDFDFFTMRIVTNLCHGSHHHFASKTEKLKSARTPAKLAEQVERTKPNTLATFFFRTDRATQS